jgi:hypothetical protein
MGGTPAPGSAVTRAAAGAVLVAAADTAARLAATSLQASRNDARGLRSLIAAELPARNMSPDFLIALPILARE